MEQFTVERTLSLVLNSDNSESLTLMKAPAGEIDAFTSKMNTSEEIREYFHEQIDAYLQAHQNYLAAQPNNRGDIVLLQLVENSDHECSLVRISVLYQKHIILMKEAIRHREVMRKAVSINAIRSTQWGIPSLLSSYLVNTMMNFRYKIDHGEREVRKWIQKRDANGHFHYERIRLLANAYDKVRKEKKELSLPTPEALERLHHKKIKDAVAKRKLTIASKNALAQLEQELALHPAPYRQGEEGIVWRIENPVLNTAKTVEEIFALYDLDQLAGIPEMKGTFDGLTDPERQARILIKKENL